MMKNSTFLKRSLLPFFREFLLHIPGSSNKKASIPAYFWGDPLLKDQSLSIHKHKSAHIITTFPAYILSSPQYFNTVIP